VQGDKKRKPVLAKGKRDVKSVGGDRGWGAKKSVVGGTGVKKQTIGREGGESLVKAAARGGRGPRLDISRKQNGMIAQRSGFFFPNGKGKKEGSLASKRIAAKS